MVYYPTAEKDIAALRQKISKAHAQAIASYFQNLNCPKEEKLRLLNDIKSNTEKQFLKITVLKRL